MRNIVSPLRGFESPLSAAALSIYAVNNFDPALVFDFDDEYYRTNRAKTTFDSALTHTRVSNATMIDSDGLLKWAPHNLLTYSEQFDNAAWVKLNTAVSADTTTDPNGTTTADEIIHTATNGDIRVLTTIQADTVHTYSTYIKVGATGEASWVAFIMRDNIDANGAIAWFNVDTGALGELSTLGTGAAAVTSEITNVGDGWYRCSITFQLAASITNLRSQIINVTADSSNTRDTTSSIAVWGAHLYRSDLGGMVNNPDTGNSYVPTTSAARYLPRRGHHVYNGSAWVNEGLLLESEARTNLLLNSGTLATQNVTVTAVPYTLHFTGTGTITLSGVSTDGPLVGTGTGENNRVSLTFTPTAGTLTLTVSGTVTNADLEVGSTLSSHKPTSGATATRAAETLTVAAADLPWPTPVVIGPELVTNGDFATGDLTGWTDSSDVGGSVAVVGNAVEITGAGASERGRIIQQTNLVVGKVYTISFNVTGGISSQVLLLGMINATITSGFYQFTFVCNNATRDLQFNVIGPGTNTFDNISVREINPLAVSIQMDGRQTYSDGNDTANNVFVAWPDTVSGNYIWLFGDSDRGTGGVTFRARANSVISSRESNGSVYSPGLFVPYNISVRVGSTFLNGATDGTALTAIATPVSIPDIDATDLNLAYDYMGTIRTFRVWDKDLGDTGIAEAST